MVEIGPDRKKYHVHKALLVHHSEHFAKALNGTSKEADEGIVTLKDVEPAVFNIYVHWLYHQSLPGVMTGTSWNAVMDPALSKPLDTFLIKVKAYGFGDEFLDSSFQREMKEEIIQAIVHELEQPSWAVDVVTWAFENIIPCDTLLQLLVNHFCDQWDVDGSEEDDAAALELFPVEFCARVMRRFAELRRPDSPEHQDACYIKHVSNDEINACGKAHVYYDFLQRYGYLRGKES